MQGSVTFEAEGLNVRWEIFYKSHAELLLVETEVDESSTEDLSQCPSPVPERKVSEGKVDKGNFKILKGFKCKIFLNS